MFIVDNLKPRFTLIVSKMGIIKRNEQLEITSVLLSNLDIYDNINVYCKVAFPKGAGVQAST